MMAAKPGDRINNYLLEEIVGGGSFAQVWRARHHVLNNVVAIKILTDGQYLRNFRQEGVVVHGLRHPNIVRILDLDPYADLPYLIMEYVDGPSLRAVIERYPQGLPIDACLKVMRGVLAGLQEAHQAGLVHRDVKPANILLRLPHGDLDRLEEGDVKLADFGLGQAASLTTASIMQSGSLVTEEGRSIAGTLVYMSPEQRAGEHIDGRSDLYSCAVVLFEMLTGAVPAGSDLPSMVRNGVPPFLDEVFRRAYTRLERRFASAEAMLSALPVPPSAGRGQTLSTCAWWVGDGARPPTAGAARTACPACRRPVQADDNFCVHCGRQLTDHVPRCPSCRAFVNRGDRFCIFCGSGLPPASSED